MGGGGGGDHVNGIRFLGQEGGRGGREMLNEWYLFEDETVVCGCVSMREYTAQGVLLTQEKYRYMRTIHYYYYYYYR